MNRATPVQMRKALEAVDQLRKAGVLFVPIPVINEDDRYALVDQMLARLQELEDLAHNEQNPR